MTDKNTDQKTEQNETPENVQIPLTEFVSINVDGTFSLTDEGAKLAGALGDAIQEVAASFSKEGQEDVKYLDIHVALDILNQDIAKIVQADFDSMRQSEAEEGEEA